MPPIQYHPLWPPSNNWYLPVSPAMPCSPPCNLNYKKSWPCTIGIRCWRDLRTRGRRTDNGLLSILWEAKKTILWSWLLFVWFCLFSIHYTVQFVYSCLYFLSFLLLHSILALAVTVTCLIQWGNPLSHWLGVDYPALSFGPVLPLPLPYDEIPLSRE